MPDSKNRTAQTSDESTDDNDVVQIYEAGPITQLRWLKRDGERILQFGKDAIVFKGGNFSHNTIMWTNVPTVSD